MKKIFIRKTEERKLLGRCDVLIIILVAIICFSVYIPTLFCKGDVIAKVNYDGDTIKEINLSKNEEKFDLTVGNCRIEIEKNEIFFVESPCRDKVCIEFGRLSKSGQFASCAPEKVTIILKGGNDKSLPDAVTY